MGEFYCGFGIAAEVKYGYYTDCVIVSVRVSGLVPKILMDSIRGVFGESNQAEKNIYEKQFQPEERRAIEDFIKELVRAIRDSTRLLRRRDRAVEGLTTWARGLAEEGELEEAGYLDEDRWDRLGWDEMS